MSQPPSQRSPFPALEALTAADVTVELNAAGNLILRPTSAVTSDLVAIVREYKAELIEWYTRPISGTAEPDPSDDCPTFEIGDRVRLKGRPPYAYDHGVVVMLTPFDDGAVMVEAAADCYARHTCTESNRLVLIDYSSPSWRITAELDARCEQEPFTHYQVDLEQQCRGQFMGPRGSCGDTFTAMAHELVHCRDVGPAEFTLDELMQWRPTLEWVQCWVNAEIANARGKIWYCGIRAWKKDGRPDQTIREAVGPHSDDDDVTYVYPWLKTEIAEYWMFHQFYDQLPDCRNCLCA